MLRRAIAWAILIGFVCLLLNLLVWQKYIIQSLYIYFAIVIIYLIYMGKSKKQNSEDDNQRDNTSI